jgi:predicted ATP-grasp superfamily ATP-dependent carboligase
MSRLKVFVFDQLAAGAVPARPLPQAFLHQGDMLLQALLSDLGALPGVEVVTGASFDGAQVRPAAHGANGHAQDRPAAEELDFGTHFAAGMQAADAVWPLANESGRALEHLSRGILRQAHPARQCTGSGRVAASKLKLARVLPTAAWRRSPPTARTPLPRSMVAWVVKPDDGAGCLDTRLFSDRAAALAWIRASAAEGYVLQPFIAGKLGSLSLICCDGVARLLACNLERVAMRDNRFHFLGSVVNGLADDDGALAAWPAGGGGHSQPVGTMSASISSSRHAAPWCST